MLFPAILAFLGTFFVGFGSQCFIEASLPRTHWRMSPTRYKRKGFILLVIGVILISVCGWIINH